MKKPGDDKQASSATQLFSGVFFSNFLKGLFFLGLFDFLPLEGEGDLVGVAVATGAGATSIPARSVEKTMSSSLFCGDTGVEGGDEGSSAKRLRLLCVWKAGRPMDAMLLVTEFYASFCGWAASVLLLNCSVGLIYYRLARVSR